MFTIYLFTSRDGSRSEWYSTEGSAIDLARERGGAVECVELLRKISSELLSAVLNLGSRFPDGAEPNWIRCHEIAKFPGRPGRRRAPVSPRSSASPRQRQLRRPFISAPRGGLVLYRVASASSYWYASEGEVRKNAQSGLVVDVFTFLDIVTAETLVEILNLADDFPVKVIDYLVTHRTLDVSAPAGLRGSRATPPSESPVAHSETRQATQSETETEFARQAIIDSQETFQNERAARVRKLVWTALVVVGLVGVGVGGWFLLDQFRSGPSAAEHFARAQDYSERGDVRAAIIELKSALRKDSEFVEARELLAWVYVDAGQGPPALKEIGRVQELGVNDAELEVLRLQAMLLDAQFEQVLLELQAPSVELEPVTVMILKGRSHLGLEQFHLANRVFLDVEKLDTGNVQAKLGVARVAFAQRRYQDARRLIPTVLADGADKRQALLLQGNLELVTGEFLSAERVFLQVLKLSKLDFSAHLGLVRAYLAQGDEKAADESIRSAETLWPDHPLLLYLKAMSSLLQGDLETARSNLRTVLSVAPDHTPSLLTLAAIYFHSESYALAENELKKLLDTEPRNMVGRKLLAATYLRMNQPADVISTLESEFVLAQDAEQLMLLGHAFVSLEDFDKGTRYLERAAERSPGIVALRTQVAMAHLVAGVTGDAITALSEIVELRPRNQQASVLLVLSHLHNGDFETALPIALDFRDAYPDSALSYGLLGLAYEKMGALDEARQHYREALKLRPDYVTPMLNLARLSLGDNHQEADRFFAVLRAQAEDRPDALAALVQLGIERGDWDVVREMLERVVTEDPGLVLPQLLLCDVYVGLGFGEQALQIAERVIALAPDDARAVLALGRAQRVSGDPTSAIETLAALVKNDPRAREPYFELGLAEAESGNRLQATAYLQRVLKHHPGFYPAKVALARLELIRGRNGKARLLVEQLRQERPEDAVAQVLLGDVMMAEAEFDQAVTVYREVFEKASGVEALVKLFRALWFSGQSQSAYDMLQQWLDEHPRDVVVRAVLASAYLQANQKQKAIAQYEEILELDPEHVNALNDLAWLYAREGDPRGKGLAERAYRLSPENPNVLDTYAWELLKEGNIEQAFPLIDQARELLPDNPAVLYHFAAAVAHRGDRLRAMALLRQALNADATFEERAEAKALLDELIENDG